jgi:hypothetical protein
MRLSNYEVVGQLPLMSNILGLSGSGKTVQLQTMILDINKGMLRADLHLLTFS